LTLPYLSFPTTSSKSLNATPNLASTGTRRYLLVFGDIGVKALMESYVVVPVNEVIQAIKIVSVAVVAVKELLYLTAYLGMLYPGCYQLYAQRFNVTLESAVPFLFTILSVSSELTSVVSSSKGMMPQ